MILELKEHTSIKKKNARDLIIKGVNKNTLNIGDKIPVTFKSTLGKFNTYYAANYIKWISNNECMVQEKELNDSSIYLLPLIAINCTNNVLEIPNRTFFGFNHLLINAYIINNNTLGIVYRDIPSKGINEIKNKLKGHGEVQVLDDNRFILFSFRINSNNYLNTIRLFKEGKFKEFDVGYTRLTTLFHGYSLDNIVYKILMNDPKLREEMSTKYGYAIPEDCSLKSKPNLDNELLSKNFKLA